MVHDKFPVATVSGGSSENLNHLKQNANTQITHN